MNPETRSGDFKKLAQDLWHMARSYPNISTYRFQFGYDNIEVTVSRMEVLDCFSLDAVEGLLQSKYQGGGGVL